MPLSSTFGSPSIFQNGKLKPGVYKFQNLLTETYLDIHLHSTELCCRPAKDLAAGRGLVRLRSPPQFTHLTATKWKIRGFGDGYAIWRVSLSMQLAIVRFMRLALIDVEPRLIQEILISSVVR